MVKPVLTIVKSILNLLKGIDYPPRLCHNACTSRHMIKNNVTKLLLVDDEKMITEPLAGQLRQSGYDVLVAHDGRSGLETALQEKPDLVILDILLPGMDGWAVCKELRQASTVPILMLTALGDEVDRIVGLELGADDYLVKPFSTRELLARIRALLRRVKFEHLPSRPQQDFIAGDLRLDLDMRQAYKNSEQLILRYKEFELLSYLMSKAGLPVSRAELFDQVWGTDWLGDTRTLDVHIRWLREKIEDDPSNPQYIQTIRGYGYRFIAFGDES